MTYDASVFTFVEGSAKCIASDAKNSSFQYNSNAGAYVAFFQFESAKNFSGDMFQFTLRINDNAQVDKSASVSIAPSVRDNAGNITCTAKNTAVSVACKHSYDNSCDTTCNGCGAERSITHSWDSGKITKEATCTADGIKTYTCSVCKETKTEKVSAKGHKYTNDCDTSCNTCGAERSIQHSYSTKWSSDGSKHWHACTVCGTKKDEAKHTPGAAATDSTPQTCTACGYVLQPALGHTHDFDDTWTKDEMGHWYACSSCDEVKSYQDHSYENDCDTSCDVCGYIRAAEHVYLEQWASDTNGHWHECSVCGDQLEMEPHVPGPEATENAPQICMVCGYELTPMVGHTHDHTWAGDDTHHWKACACGNIMDQAEHSWNEGVVTKEPTQDAPGVKTYTCSVCGGEKTEQIPANAPTEGTEPPVSEPQTTPEEPRDSFPWGIVIAAGAGMLVLCGAFLVIGIMIGKKQTGKYTSK